MTRMQELTEQIVKLQARVNELEWAVDNAIVKLNQSDPEMARDYLKDVQ